MSRERVGLFELSASNGPKTVDVVAVHGLQGDALKTWEHENGSLWLRDFLPKDLPSAYVMTFGYDSTVAFSKSVAEIEDKALDLLNRLGAERAVSRNAASKAITIIFICHSLGGILVKKAIVLAYERCCVPEFEDIANYTMSIAFMGVPHKGSTSAWWGNLAANILNGVSIGTSTNTRLITDLRKNSSNLVKISTQFIHRSQSLRIYTFYETKRLGPVVVRSYTDRDILLIDQCYRRLSIKYPRKSVFRTNGFLQLMQITEVYVGSRLSQAKNIKLLGVR
ncbi:hypothetical protein N7G274_000186 [Stereocaulon virgatum]|uniref:DUF676 domain-containing protein n=1 Tax=Stereocaulon virgatum TaxID=373712 RepID=A0ABR4ARF6_9LECA